MSLSADAVVIVTAGSYGAGRAVARRLAQRGCAIVVVYLEDQPRAEAAVEEILGAGGRIVAVRADVGDELDVERLFDESIAAFGRLDLVVDATPHGAPRRLREAASERGIAVSRVSPVV